MNHDYLDELASILKAAPTEVVAFLYFLIDVSASMGGMKLQAAQSGAQRLADDLLESGWRVGVIQFNHDAKLVATVTRSRDSIQGGLAGLRPGGATDIAGAIDFAAEHLGRFGRRAMVLVTDGQSDPGPAMAAADRAKASGIQIVCRGTDDADEALLERLASSADLSKHVPQGELAASIADVARLLPPAREDDDSDGIIKL